MEYTNRFNLPPEIVKALTKDRYNPEGEQDLGDFSASTLIAPVRQTILKARHPDKLKIFDVMDNFWAFTGSIAHKVLEEHGEDNAIIERRFYAPIQGKKLSGQVDHYKNKIITDYKSTKVYKILKGNFSDWIKQLNIYAYLARVNGYEVERARVFAFILDFSKSESFKANYPECQIKEIQIAVWTLEEQKKYIDTRVELLKESKNLPDEKLPYCTDEEMWRNVNNYAIMKEGQVKAVKVFDLYSEAFEHYDAKYKDSSQYSIVTRYSSRKRCLDHCSAAPVCNQHKEYLEIEEKIAKEKASAKATKEILGSEGSTEKSI